MRRLVGAGGDGVGGPGAVGVGEQAAAGQGVEEHHGGEFARRGGGLS